MNANKFGYHGLRKGESKKFSKENKLLTLRKIENDGLLEKMPSKNSAAPKASRLEMLRMCREEKEVKKVELKSKRPIFKVPSITRKPPGALAPVVEKSSQGIVRSFVPKKGGTALGTSAVSKKLPLRDHNSNPSQKSLLNKFPHGVKSAKELHVPRVVFEEMSPVFPEDISCIEGEIKNMSFAPLEFTFSGVENVMQFDFVEPPKCESITEPVTRRSTPIRPRGEAPPIRPRKNIVDISIETETSDAKSFSVPKNKQCTPKLSNSEPQLPVISKLSKSDPKKPCCPTFTVASSQGHNSKSKTFHPTTKFSKNEKAKPTNATTVVGPNIKTQKQTASLLGVNKVKKTSKEEDVKNTRNKIESSNKIRVIPPAKTKVPANVKPKVQSSALKRCTSLNALTKKSDSETKNSIGKGKPKTCKNLIKDSHQPVSKYLSLQFHEKVSESFEKSKGDSCSASEASVIEKSLKDSNSPCSKSIDESLVENSQFKSFHSNEEKILKMSESADCDNISNAESSTMSMYVSACSHFEQLCEKMDVTFKECENDITLKPTGVSQIQSLTAKLSDGNVSDSFIDVAQKDPFLDLEITKPSIEITFSAIDQMLDSDSLKACNSEINSSCTFPSDKQHVTVKPEEYSSVETSIQSISDSMDIFSDSRSAKISNDSHVLAPCQFQNKTYIAKVCDGPLPLQSLSPQKTNSKELKTPLDIMSLSAADTDQQLDMLKETSVNCCNIENDMKCKPKENGTTLLKRDEKNSNLSPYYLGAAVSDASFIENEQLPNIDLDMLDTSLDISCLADVRRMSHAFHGMQFENYRQPKVTMPRATFDSDILEDSFAQSKDPDRSMVSLSDHFSKLKLMSKAGNKNESASAMMLDEQDSILSDVFIDSKSPSKNLVNISRGISLESSKLSVNESDAEFCPPASVSLLGTPQVPKTPRGPIKEDLMMFTPLIKF